MLDRTGASSGLGLALLLRILARTAHDRIIAAVRDLFKLESALNSRLVQESALSYVPDWSSQLVNSNSGSQPVTSVNGNATFASLVEAGRLKALKMDVTEPWQTIRDKIQEVVERWAGEKVDVLVNNAGVGIAGLSEEGGYVDYILHLIGYYEPAPMILTELVHISGS